ncbi:hypothetical protein ACFLT5_02120 [Chloroflexota bacterium]
MRWTILALALHLVKHFHYDAGMRRRRRQGLDDLPGKAAVGTELGAAGREAWERWDGRW